MDWTNLGWMLLYLSPALPLAVAWKSSILSQNARRVASVVPQTVATISLFWIAASFVSENFLGPEYSNLRGGMILGNMIADLAICILAFMPSISPGTVRQRIATGAAGLLLALVWYLIRSISFVV